MNKSKLLLTLIPILNISSSLFGQSLNSDHVKDLISKARKKFNVPAIAVALMTSDSIYVNELAGVRVFDAADEVTPHDLFHIGSCSKSVLAVAAGKLVESGAVSWQTKFFDVIPELKGESNPAYQDITLEDFLLCKAGFQPYTSDEEKFPKIDAQVSNRRYEFIRHLLKQPPSSKPTGEGKFEHVYSNASYTAIAVMLERIDGLTYEERMAALLADFDIPLNLGFPNKLNHHQPWGHEIKDGNIKKFSPEDEYVLSDLITPAGDLSMTPTAFARYLQFHLKGLAGEDTYLSSSTINQIHFGHEGFSMGVVNSQWASQTFSGMDGSAGTFFCRGILIPQTSFAFTIMMNAGSGTGTMQAMDWLTTRIIKKQRGWWWKFWL